MRNLLSRQGTRKTPQGDLDVYKRGKHLDLMTAFLGNQISAWSSSRGRPSVVDDRTASVKSSEALNNNSNSEEIESHLGF